MEFIEITKFKTFFVFFKIFQHFPEIRKCFGVFGVFCTINRYFEYRIRILRSFLYMQTQVKYIFEHFSTPKIEIFRPPQNLTISQKCEQFSCRGFLALTNVKKEKYRCVVRSVLGRTGPYSKLTAGGVHTKKTAKNGKTIVLVFPRGSNKMKSNNDDKHGHGQEKRRPSTYVEGKNKYILQICYILFYF